MFRVLTRILCPCRLKGTLLQFCASWWMPGMEVECWWGIYFAAQSLQIPNLKLGYKLRLNCVFLNYVPYDCVSRSVLNVNWFSVLIAPLHNNGLRQGPLVNVYDYDGLVPRACELSSQIDHWMPISPCYWKQTIRATSRNHSCVSFSPTYIAARVYQLHITSWRTLHCPQTCHDSPTSNSTTQSARRHTRMGTADDLPKL